MALLDIRGLVSVFQTPRGPIRAVDDVDLAVERGQVVCLVGESGCGKSALANSVMGLMPLGRAAHPRGEILFDGKNLLRADDEEYRAVRGRRVGMIFQEPLACLNPVLRIGDQVAESLLVHDLATLADARAAAIGALAAVGIPEPERVAAQYPHQLSGGMRQRAMIAGATIAQPELLIADEPTTALDVTIEAQILALLDGLRRDRGMAILLITHDLGIVAEIGDRIAVMYAGQIVETGAVADVFASPRHPYTQGLLRSMPGIGQGRGRLEAIPGNVPSPHQRPEGCRFQPRCAYAEARCLQPVPLAGDAARASRCVRTAAAEETRS